MKKFLILLLALFSGLLAKAQTVENITVTPKDDHIVITYRIGASTAAQIYNVTLSCSMDGGPRFEPKSLIGDYGENIVGGKSYYTIEWDVFQDVEEVGDAEFFIKVDLVSDAAAPANQPVQQQPQEQPRQQQPQQQPSQQPSNAMYPEMESGASNVSKEVSWKAYIAYTGSLNSPIGLSFGTLKKGGTYASFRFGSSISDLETEIWVAGTVGLTRYAIESGKYRLHVYAGGGGIFDYYEVYGYDAVTGLDWIIEAGAINTIGKLDLNLGLEYVHYWGVFPVFGVGIAF